MSDGYKSESVAERDDEETSALLAKRAEFARMPTTEVHALYVKETEAERGAHERAKVLRAELYARQALADKRAALAKLTAEVEAAEKGASS